MNRRDLIAALEARQDALTSALRRPAKQFLAALQSGLSLSKLEAALGRPADLVTAVLSALQDANAANLLIAACTDAALVAAKHTALEEIRPAALTAGLRASDRAVLAAHVFDRTNPLALTELRDHGAKLVQGITAETRKGLVVALDDALVRGLGPRTAARWIRSLIGLTERDVIAVGRYRDELESGDSNAFSRLRRDRRYDAMTRVLTQGGTVPKARVDDAVAAYARRLLALRAETIARNEALVALSLGRAQAWRNVIRDPAIGLGPGDTYRLLVLARDERTCVKCRTILSMNRDGRRLDEPFQTPGGPMMDAPFHTQCRCVSVVRVDPMAAGVA